MKRLSLLERAVLVDIARQMPDYTEALTHQLTQAKVVGRENTGVGFYTTLDVASVYPIRGLSSPISHVGATVAHLQHGMGFLLWLKEGRMHKLEGFSYGGESTSDIDFESVHFELIGPGI
jgi:hypothetical protein